MKKILMFLLLVGLIIGGLALVQSSSNYSKGSSSFQLFGTVELNEGDQNQDDVVRSEEEDDPEEEDGFGNFIENHKTPWTKKIVIEDGSQSQSK